VFENSAIVPPSYRFPPLREGNRDLVPPAGRGNLTEGVIDPIFEHSQPFTKG